MTILLKEMVWKICIQICILSVVLMKSVDLQPIHLSRGLEHIRHPHQYPPKVRIWSYPPVVPIHANYKHEHGQEEIKGNQYIGSGSEREVFVQRGRGQGSFSSSPSPNIDRPSTRLNLEELGNGNFNFHQNGFQLLGESSNNGFQTPTQAPGRLLKLLHDKGRFFGLGTRILATEGKLFSELFGQVAGGLSNFTDRLVGSGDSDDHHHHYDHRPGVINYIITNAHPTQKDPLISSHPHAYFNPAHDHHGYRERRQFLPTTIEYMPEEQHEKLSSPSTIKSKSRNENESEANEKHEDSSVEESRNGGAGRNIQQQTLDIPSFKPMPISLFI